MAARVLCSSMEPTTMDSKNLPEVVVEEEEDRISNLPDVLLHQILSSLNMKKVVQTSVLSTRWRYLWISHPFLKFIQNPVVYNPQATTFKAFVDKVLSTQQINCSSSDIQRFILDCNCSDYADIYTWILAAVSRNTQELYCSMRSREQSPMLPNCIFTCESLRVLELKWRDNCLNVNLSDPVPICLPLLNTLHLQAVKIQGDDIFNKIFSSCPVLESLTLRCCGFDQKRVKISALQLKHLVIENWNDHSFTSWKGYSFRLNAPNLISFRWKELISCVDYYFIDNLPALVKADLEMSIVQSIRRDEPQRIMKLLGALCNVESLTLSSDILLMFSRPEAPALLESHQFCNLRYLKLRTSLSGSRINGITYLLKISLNIESLHLEIVKGSENESAQPYWDEGACNSLSLERYKKEAGLSLSLQCMLYHLKFVEIRGVLGRVNEFAFVEILLKNAMVMEKLVLYSKQRHTESRLAKLNEQLQEFAKGVFKHNHVTLKVQIL